MNTDIDNWDFCKGEQRFVFIDGVLLPDTRQASPAAPEGLNVYITNKPFGDGSHARTSTWVRHHFSQDSGHWKHGVLSPEDQHETIRAAESAYAATKGDAAKVSAFASDPHLWPGKRGHGPRWEEAVSTALLDLWHTATRTDAGLTSRDLDRLRADARRNKLRLTPNQERKINGLRLYSLDYCFGDGMTTHDVLSSGPDPFEALYGHLPDDPRISAVLARLTPTERAVAVAYAAPTARWTWTEAAAVTAELHPAAFAGVDPCTFGERVRRKLRRLGDQFGKGEQR
ncbi:hypothetical protein ACFXGI_16795 [Streptomyces sp. NPDC059355]|uniref:hypothetical protein n=1 Tax=Streptomyces sp. NPDC059355 TaxID=3346811 RepID=UPI0036A0E7DE